jgi:hypothetical protein
MRRLAHALDFYARVEEFLAKHESVLLPRRQDAHRQTLLDAFQSPDDPPFFLVSLKARGLGLNVTNANYISARPMVEPRRRSASDRPRPPHRPP